MREREKLTVGPSPWGVRTEQDSGYKVALRLHILPLPGKTYLPVVHYLGLRPRKIFPFRVSVSIGAFFFWYLGSHVGEA